jgi:uncharacterized SAM-binding protein YcdF (DUF218 family)
MLKRLVAPLVLPMPFGLILILVGLILLWFTRRQKVGKLLVTLGTLIYVVLSCGPLSDAVVGRLETEYTSITDSQTLLDKDVKWIVVLGGGYTADPVLPVTSQLAPATLGRLVEGIRLYRQFPGSKLILSGGTSVGYKVTVAEAMAGAAEALGVPSGDLVLESESLNTEDEANLIGPMVGQDSFILVTSASHMPRAMALFKKRTMDPVPAPADYLIKQGPPRSFPWDLYPDSDRLARADRAMHEYIGMVWAGVRGEID